ncbi:hypothetical protein CW670_10900 [Macrococcoides caseolyticum]|uniref:hypothetical protein n=1 Tax=Macrococcoides caseolyticum TaxID=69966 RepID=UPI000C323239|nr:hypothetical protein [Macrococcus caseolyticus]PKE73639.1 hypothetical protein CW670_10900 [Macrococcus caseolyticus]
MKYSKTPLEKNSLENDSNYLKLKSVEFEKSLMQIIKNDEKTNRYDDFLNELSEKSNHLKKILYKIFNKDLVDKSIKVFTDTLSSLNFNSTIIKETFHDLGTMNKLDNFIGNVEEKIKLITDKSSIINLNDSDSLEKLNKQLTTLNKLVTETESQEKQKNDLDNLRQNYLKNTLLIENQSFMKIPNINNLDDRQLKSLYNFSKDMQIALKEINSNDVGIRKLEYQNYQIINNILDKQPHLKDERINDQVKLKIKDLRFDDSILKKTSDEKIKIYHTFSKNIIDSLPKEQMKNINNSFKKEHNHSVNLYKSNKAKNNPIYQGLFSKSSIQDKSDNQKSKQNVR